MKSLFSKLLLFGVAAGCGVLSPRPAAAQPGAVDSYTNAVPHGYTLIANHLDNGNNTLPFVLPIVPHGSQVSKWDEATQTFSVDTYDQLAGGWTDSSGLPSTTALGSREAVFLYNPGAAYLLTFTGSPRTPTPPPALTRTALHYVSRETKATAKFDDLTGQPPEEDALLLRWDATTQGYQTNRFTGGQWQPSEPVADIGEGVVIWLPPATPPVITMQPMNLTVAPGQDATFTVTAGGTPPLSYHWSVWCPPSDPNWPNCGCIPTPVPDLPMLRLMSVSAQCAAGYFVVVSNAQGAVTSSIATLTVSSNVMPPQMRCPGDLLVDWNGSNGMPVTFSATATDNCLSNLAVQCQPPSGSLFALGATPVLCTTADGMGNSNSCMFTVTVEDRQVGVAAPVIRCSLLGPAPAGFTLCFDSQLGVNYTVEYKASLGPGAWTPLTTVPGNGSVLTVTDPNGAAQSRYYRVRANVAVTAGALATLLEPPTAPPGQPCACGADEREQMGPPFVHLFSGELHLEEADLAIRGRGLDFVWARRYRSRAWPGSAQGNHWDFSYNIRVERNGQHLDVLDGNGRRDTYYLQPNGTYAAAEFFREGRLTNNVFTLVFPDTGTWVCRPLDGSPAEGRIARSTDRNGNALTFDYSAAGRLTNIIDTLGRNIRVDYNPDGFIASITDFLGRQVTYTYYQNADTDGSFGDLKSATSPVVTGTPNGNDFPAGKTTLYTYSKGFADARLNHNLLTVTDPKGQTWLRNTYAATQNPADFDFDRLVLQTHGAVGELLAFHYLPQTPAASNRYALVKAIVNDRVGNVREFTSDFRNRTILHRAFTGRAVAGQFVTESLNRPTAKLRATDPTFFETRSEWNGDSQLVRKVEPNGNISENVYESVLNPNADRRARGNLRIHRERPGALGGDQTVRQELFEYDSNMAGCCGFNFVIRHTDARSNVTQHTYDTRGNRTRTIGRLPTIVDDWEYNAFGQMTARVHAANAGGHRRRDHATYYASGPQTGYLRQTIVDAPNLALTTTFEYDAVGNIVRRIDPRGFDTLFTLNALNQVVRELSAEVLPGIRYEKLTFYDANNNVVRVDTENRDELGVLQANTHFTETRDYGILNELIRTTREADPTHNVVEEQAYDANRNRTLVRFGEATAGRDPNNVVRSLFDERDLPYREIQGDAGPVRSTAQQDYDGNGNVAAVQQGLEGPASVTRIQNNGFDEPVIVTDPMINVRRFGYDPNGNPVSERVDGELIDGPDCLMPVRLSQQSDEYDAEDRHAVMRDTFFHAVTQAPLRSGQSVFRVEHAPNSQQRREIDENGHPELNGFDTANRPLTVTDARGNTITSAYDANGNVIASTEVDKCDLGSPDQVFVTTNRYDALNRLIETVDNAANIKRHGYDSRNNRVLEIDGRGNVTRQAFDGLNRLLQTARLLTTTGDGNGGPAGAIVTAQAWDDSSRLTAQFDPNGNATRHAYDSLNRRIATTNEDGTVHTVSYDVHNNPLVIVDPNGTRITNTYDLLHRLTARSIQRAPGVLGTTYELYQYDGLSRMIRAEDDDSVVTREYNSLGEVVRETQQRLPGGPVRVVLHEFDEAGNKVGSTYPGGRLLGRTYDALHRVKTITDAAGTLASYDYIGAKRTQRRDYANATRFTPGYDAIRRVSNVQHARFNMAPFANRSFAWDRMNNKTNITDLSVGPQNSRNLSYDSANRLAVSQSLSGGPTLAYGLDGAGNRTFVAGGPDAGPYALSPAPPEPADFQMNQYTATPFDSRAYDRNGNLTNDGARGFLYDFRNHLVEVRPLAMQAVVFTYAYDPYGRRIEKNVQGAITRFYYDGETEIEEQDAAGATLATYVWADRTEILEMRRGAFRYFYHADDLDSVMELTDAAGNILEQYRYGDYGTPTFYLGGMPLEFSEVGNPWLFTGHRYDPETGLYHCKTRYFDPRAGRFTSRDSLGIWGDPAAVGNGFTYTGNNPYSFQDPDGTRRSRAQRQQARQERREERRERRDERRQVRRDYRDNRKALHREFRDNKQQARRDKRDCLSVMRAEGRDRKQCREAKKEKMRDLRGSYTRRWPKGSEGSTTTQMRCQVDQWTQCSTDADCLVEQEDGTIKDLGPCVEVTIKKVWSSGKGQFAANRKDKMEKLKPLRWWNKK